MAVELGLDGKAAIVTGGSRGIGKAICLELAAHGVNVAAVGRDEAALARTLTEAEALPGRLVAVARELRDPDAPAEVVNRTVETFGRLDILANSAGATKRGDFLEMPDTDVIDGFAMKFHGTVRFCRAAWPHLKARNGCIVNISGVGAHTPSWEFTVGGPVNSALVNFTKAIAEGGMRDGIRINLLCPGHIATDRLVARIESLARQRGISVAEARDTLRRELGVARFGEPKDIAYMVSFLCSNRASYVHGATINIDGGATPGI
jgi:3-oxoacyl-[acyl-carrier protein] reductase